MIPDYYLQKQIYKISFFIKYAVFSAVFDLISVI